MIVMFRRTGILLVGVICLLIGFLFQLGNQPYVGAFAARTNHIIVLDAGHGNFDGGAKSPNGTLEKDLNLAIAKKLEKCLGEHAFTVIMTRSDDAGIHTNPKSAKKSDMHVREKKMNESGADMFVSIHMNKFPDAACSGPQVFYSRNMEESELLGRMVQSSLKEMTHTKREAKQAQNTIYLLKQAELPAVIVECGFLSNALEEAKLKNEEYQTRLADSICRGILSYYTELEAKHTVKPSAAPTAETTTAPASGI